MVNNVNKLLCLGMWLALMASGCQSDIDMPVQGADVNNDIRFQVSGTQGTITRAASNRYNPCNADTDPETMGVFGYHDLALDEPILSNIRFNKGTTDDVQGIFISSLDEDEKASWADYKEFDQFDFFAYMPFTVGATVTKKDGSLDYTLSVPVTIDNVFLADTKLLPLICNDVGHKPETGIVVPMQFDQTLTGFKFRFKLGAKMDNIRDITIKKVRLYGSDLPYRGTVTRTFTYNTYTKLWRVGKIAWDFAANAPYKKNMSGADDQAANAFMVNNTAGNLLLNSNTFQSWGGTFYTFPTPDFKPTIEVTYDVKLNSTEGSGIISRQDVVSTIQLNSTNFKNYNGGEIDVVNNLDILIVPNYLYVLADDDQHAAIIIVKE